MMRLGSRVTWEFARSLFPSSCSPVASLILLISVILNNVSSCQHGLISPDPNNCANYLHCDHDTELNRPCPQGLHFNPSSLTCDWPANVQCGGGGSVDGGGGEEASPSPSPILATTSTVLLSSSTLPPPAPPPPESTTTTERTMTSTMSPFQSSTPAPLVPPFTGDSSNVRFAPYFDVNMKGPSLTQVHSKTGQKDFTLAFALGSSEGCKPKWGGVSEIDDPSILGPVKELQSLGGQFIVATGGAMGPYFEHLCNSVDDLAGAYKRVMDAVGTNHVDVDIEATVDADRVNRALAKVQQERPNTTVSYTLMVQAEDYGLTPILGVDILRNAKSNGVQVTIVNPMTMEFGGPSPDFGDSVIGAATSVLQQMKQIWPEKSPQELRKMLGVTPMLGKNYNGKVFTLEHARKLVRWGNENKIGLLAFWSVGRDNGNCAGGGISPSCSSIVQTEYEFTKIFQEFTG